MKIRDIIGQEKATLSFEVFPPKKDTDFASVEAAALGIAALRPSYMSVTYGAGAFCHIQSGKKSTGDCTKSGNAQSAQYAHNAACQQNAAHAGQNAFLEIHIQ